MDTLKHFLECSGISQSDFAKQVGTSRGYMHDILAGRRRPGMDLAAKIAAATNGAVPIEVWAQSESTP